MKKMFNLALAIAAMSSALSLASCDKFSSSSGNDKKDDSAEIVEGVLEGVLEGALSKDSLANDNTGAAATPAPDADKPAAPADKK